MIPTLATMLLTLTVAQTQVAQERQVLADGDLVVSSKTLVARYGLRCGNRPVQHVAVLVLDEDCDLITASGDTRRFRMRLTAWGPTVDFAPVSKTSGDLVFHPATIHINGSTVSSTFGTLRLLADGTYRLGRATGHWKLDGSSLRLDGMVGLWGLGQVSQSGVIFSFNRGPLNYVVWFAEPTEAHLAER